MKLEFTKMHGLGNDFVVIDAISQIVNLTPKQIKYIANRNFGIGCDQLLLVEKPVNANADFKYRIFNADGGEVAQCGNGARCFAKFVTDKKLTSKKEICVDTNAGQLVLHLNSNGSSTVNMGIPQHLPSKIPIKLDNKYQALKYTLTVAKHEYKLAAVSLGNPHAVLQVNDIELAPVNTLGAILEAHSFFPEHANIGFMQIIDKQNIKLRVFERGVGETLACGSGACAAVVIGIQQELLSNQVNVILSGGALNINWQGYGQAIFMTGPATVVFTGQIDLT